MSLSPAGPMASALLLALVAFSSRAPTQCVLPETQKLPASVERDSEFGYAAAVDGRWAVLGALLRGLNGSAFVYEHGAAGWGAAQELTASDGDMFDFFGAAVDVDGDVIVVGAPDDSDAGFWFGSAYVFRHDGSAWRQEQKLVASDAGREHRFGWAVAVHGNTIVVSAPFHNGVGTDAGAVYLFEFDGSSWRETRRILPTGPSTGDLFGLAVALDDDVAVVGAKLDDAAAQDAGSVTVYRRSGGAWVREALLVPSDASSSHFFGTAVDVDGTMILVGANGDADAGLLAGAAYVFEHTGSAWSQTQKLTAIDGSSQDWFGISVALDGELALVGASHESSAAPLAGAAYAFRRVGSAWLELAKLRATDAQNHDALGWAVGLSGRVAIVGAPAPYMQSHGPGGYAYQLPSLALDANQDVYRAGDPLRLLTCAGVPAAPGVLFVVEVNGIGLWMLVDSGTFDVAGQRSLRVVVPPGLAGIALTLQSFGLGPRGRIESSNRRSIAFQ